MDIKEVQEWRSWVQGGWSTQALESMVTAGTMERGEDGAVPGSSVNGEWWSRKSATVGTEMVI